MAQHAFLDPKRIIAEDVNHNTNEERYYCIGRVDAGIITVRFTYRGSVMSYLWRRILEKSEEAI